MRAIVPSGQFRKDVKRCQKRGKDMDRLKAVITLLMTDQPLGARYKDHPLKGAWRGYRDAHIEQDWLLIYGVIGDELRLARTGTHADLFDE